MTPDDSKPRSKPDPSAGDDSEKSGNVRDFASARPFAQAVAKYHKAGWGGTLPLPAGKKNPPPTGFTGHKAPYPDKETLLEWLNDPKHRRANIGIRLAGCGMHKDDEGIEVEYEIMGIDVDHYETDTKKKLGGDQLQALESRLGSLPPTWISSARSDGLSGIRYYRVPRGLAFRGQVDKDIEAIYKGYRFAVVWPSWHPGGGQYWWYPPGSKPDGNSTWRELEDGVPDVAGLPVLPDAWIEHLTQGRMRPDDDDELDIDMDVSVNEIYEWADETFNYEGVEGSELNEGDAERAESGDLTVWGMCSRMLKSVKAMCEEIDAEATSHDKITKAHWHLYKLASEGHIGWKSAYSLVEEHWSEDVIDRDKRDRGELHREIFRSRTNALRKIKTQVDRNIAIGAVGVPSQCTCIPVGSGHGNGPVMGSADPLGAESSRDGSQFPSGPFSWADDLGSIGDDGSGDGLEYVRYGNPDPPDEYRMNDDGNAKHFVDLFTSPGVGPGIRFVDGLGWLVWSSGSFDRSVQPRWILSNDGLIRRAWQRVRDRQEKYVELLEADVAGQIREIIAEGEDVGANSLPDAIKALRAKVKSWREFAKSSGNNRNALAALDAAKALPGVTVDINDLDKDGRLIGVANGVVELTADDAVLRPARAEDLITLNTGVAWRNDIEINRFGKQKWEEYLERFLPDEDLRRTAQVAMGHCLIGGNPEKIFIILKGDPNTGKSTMANLCAAALGDYAMAAGLSIYQNHKLNPVLAKALTRRMVVTTELSEADKLSASMVKRITGGSDVIQAELKGSNVTVERVPMFVPVVATNTVPQIDGADKALRNRLYVIPFNVAVSDKDNDKEAAQVLKNIGLEAVLNWLFEGYQIYRKEKKLDKSLMVEKESDAFAAELDSISTFASQCLRKHPSEFGNPDHMWSSDKAWLQRIDPMYASYKDWCGKVNIQPKDVIDQNRFGRRLKEIGFPQKKIRLDDGSHVRWYGVKVMWAMKGGRRFTGVNTVQESEDQS